MLNAKYLLGKNKVIDCYCGECHVDSRERIVLTLRRSQSLFDEISDAYWKAETMLLRNLYYPLSTLINSVQVDLAPYANVDDEVLQKACNRARGLK